MVPHTPVTALGLNFTSHFRFTNEAEFHRIGDALAPKKIWNELYQDESAGLADLTIRFHRGTREKPSETKDEKRISIQPSPKIRFGIFMSYNDHHDVSKDMDNKRPAEQVATIIDNQWQSSWEDAKRLFDFVLSESLKNGV